MTDFLPRFAAAMALGACLLAATASANADARYPARPLRMVVPYAAGGPTDTFARALAESWARQLGVAVLVDNRSGAGTVVGTEVVAKAVPDGYTMLMTTVAHAANQRIYAKLPYRTVEDFAAVGLAARAPLVVLVNKSVPAATLPDFIAYLRTRPGKVNYGSAGVGSAPHLAAELLNHMAGTYAVHVPYRGSAPALADLIGGHVEFMLDSTASGLAQVRSGSVRLLATSMRRRLPQTPDTPAVAEAVPGYEAYTWNGMFVPAATPAPVIRKLSDSLGRALQDPALKSKAHGLGLMLEEQPTAAALDAFLQVELDKWGRVAAAARISAE
ncbi:tripartite tricarboxylate transporter substrate binding protein [Verminephrobacter eiseniae]|uniref:tripartite tricarboxylate transporter substrate binding protein n=1 Tax=Verminephrobacter eiseniae TaxID=364317 RepID=UPI002237E4AF|nr:tripartite tricarboxylate transporter substrate binding protein [Verminephrobacter eiseniae]